MFACKVVYLWKYPRRVLPVHETALRSVRSERECYLQVWRTTFEEDAPKYDVKKKKKKRFLWKKNTVMLLWTNNADFFYVLTQGEQILSGSIGRLQFTSWSCSSYKTEHLFQKIHFFTSCLQITSKELLLHSVCAPIYGYSLKKNFSDGTLKHRKAGAS